VILPGSEPTTHALRYQHATAVLDLVLIFRSETENAKNKVIPITKPTPNTKSHPTKLQKQKGTD